MSFICKNLTGNYCVKLANCSILNRYWFLYMIVGVYLSAPFLRLMVCNASKKHLVYFVCFWFLSNGISPLTNYYFKIGFDLKYAIFTEYIGYVVLGYILHSMRFNGKKWIFVASLIFLLSFFITSYGTLILREEHGKYIALFYSYGSINVALMSCSLFLLIKMIFIDSSGNRITTMLSSLSFGVYLVHTIVQQVLNCRMFGICLHSYISNYVIEIPIQVLVIYIVSVMVSLAVYKTPLLSKTVGG